MANKGKDLEFTVNGVAESIELMDSNTNDMKSTYQIFDEISDSWDNMTDAEQQSLALLIGNKTQFEVVTSVLQNFENAEKATVTAMLSANSAMIENSRYMASLEALKFLGLVKQG